MAERFTFDANVFVYAADLEAGARRRMALQTIARASAYESVCTLQSLAEFYHATTRKRLLSAEKAGAYIDDWIEVFGVAHAEAETLPEAIALSTQRSLSFWDAMLIATAQSAGCTVLFSEDMNHRERFGRLTVFNPFEGDLAEVGL